MKETVQTILFEMLPKKYEEMDERDYWCKTEVVDIIHEMLTRAYYNESLNDISTSNQSWMILVYPYFDGNIEALDFLMALENLSSPQATGKEILAMIMSMGLKGKDITTFFRECCGQDYQEILKVHNLWRSKRISMMEILSHMKEGYGVRIDTDKL